MNDKFNEKHTALLESIDSELTDFYTEWLRMHISDDFETVANLSAHLAREILECLRVAALEEKKVPEHIERKWKNIVHCLDKFRHRHKVWDPPYKNEEFVEVWSEFEILLVFIMESGLNFRNIAEQNPFTTLQDALMRLKTKLDNASVSEWTISNIELADSQSEINHNLKTLAPLLAAFYRDWLRIYQSTYFKCRSYLLGHLAREISAGFKDVLSMEEDENEIKTLLKNDDLGDLNRHKSHIASIMSALDVPDFNLRAEQWIDISRDFATLAHKDRDESEKSIRIASESYWIKFEELLSFLVGGYLNLLNRVDKIRETEEPNENMVGTLSNLLEPEVIYKHFFQNLKSQAWLELLKENGWFNPKNNPVPQKDPEHIGYYNDPRWYALEYVEKIADKFQKSLCEKTVNILVDIVNTIIDYTDENGNRINNDYTNLLLIKIIGKLPVDKIKCKHITFIDWALKSKSKFGLIDQEIDETILPKFLNVGAEELTLNLLRVMLNAKVVETKYDPKISEDAKKLLLDLLETYSENKEIDPEIVADIEEYETIPFNHEIPYMSESVLNATLKEHCKAIGKLCGVKAANIVLKQIRTLIAKGVNSFDRIQTVDTKLSDVSHEDYAESLVDFVARVFQFAESEDILDTVRRLLQAPEIIIRRIALNAITHHYNDLKQLFWEWNGNPLEETDLKPELCQLMQTNCAKFNKSEIEQILKWIESAQYTPFFPKDEESRIKAIAKKRREWLSALIETGNEKVIAAYKKYEKINPAQIEHPGSNHRTEIWSGSTSPLTVEKMSTLSNTAIAKYITNFKETEVFRKSDPTERGLAQTLEKCVEASPQKFADNLLPFEEVSSFYQSSVLHGFLKAWRDKKTFDWGALLKFIRRILSFKHFWHVQYKVGFNYRNWILSTAADLIREGTKDDKHAFDVQLLPLAEEILLILVEKAEPSIFTPNESSLDALSSDRGKVFSAMINYAWLFARIHEHKLDDCRWQQSIRSEFTKRLDRSNEPSLEFSYTLGLYLSCLSYLDKEWVVGNLDRIFPLHNEDHWQAAFSGYLIHSGVYEELYSQFKANGHYQKALRTQFADVKVLDKLVKHICIGYIEDQENLTDKDSLIYQLMHDGNPNLLSGLVYFFSRHKDDLSEKVKEKVIPTWRVLFKVLSQHSEEIEYQAVLSPLSMWLGLIDKIDDEVLAWVKVSISYLDKVPGYAYTLSTVIDALRKHVMTTPEKVAQIYLEIPTREMWFLGQTKKDEVEETMRILYKKGYQEIANEICNRFGKAGVHFLRTIYEEFQTQ